MALLLILVSLIPLGISMNAVFFSGETVRVSTLQGKVGATDPVMVNPDMNPMRLVMAMDYWSKSFSTIHRYIDYRITAKPESGTVLWQASGRVASNSDTKTFSNSTNHPSIQTFDVISAARISFHYKIEPENLRYKGGTLKLKRNVTQHSLFITFTGLTLLVIGVLILANNQRK